MKVEQVTEMEDGSAMIELNLTDEELRLLVEYAVINILDKAIDDNSLAQNSG